MRAINALFNNPTLRAVLLKLRLPLGLGVVAAVALNVRHASFFPGLGVSALGALFQLWCFGCIKTSAVLAVNGPYKLMRNPMYVARFFLILGALIMTGAWWPAALFAPLYYLYMANRVRREEQKLRALFGEPYARYCARVHRFAPTVPPYPEGRFLCFESANFRRNHGLTNAVAVAAFYALCAALVFCRC